MSVLTDAQHATGLAGMMLRGWASLGSVTDNRHLPTLSETSSSRLPPCAPPGPGAPAALRSATPPRRPGTWPVTFCPPTSSAAAMDVYIYNGPNKVGTVESSGARYPRAAGIGHVWRRAAPARPLRGLGGTPAASSSTNSTSILRNDERWLEIADLDPGNERGLATGSFLIVSFQDQRLEFRDVVSLPKAR